MRASNGGRGDHRRRRADHARPARGDDGWWRPPCSGRAWPCSTPPSSTWRCRRSARSCTPRWPACSGSVTAYTLTLAGLILLGGSLGDRFGRRRVFLHRRDLVRAGLRAVRRRPGHRGADRAPGRCRASAARCSPPARWPSSSPRSPPDDRPRAIGAWSGLGGVAGAVGPFLGGWLVGSVGWRWIFLINLPLAAAVVAVTAAARAGEPGPDRARPVRHRRRRCSPRWPWPGSPTR